MKGSDPSIEHRNLVELVEEIVPPNPERFALHFEIPAVLHGARPQLAPGGELAFASGPGGMTHPLPRSVKLADE